MTQDRAIITVKTGGRYCE